MKRIRRGTTEASSSRPNRQHPTASTRRQRAAPQDHIEDTTEVEDVVPTHDSNVDTEVEDVAATQDSNVEVHAEPTEPSRVGPIDPSLLTSFKTHIAAAIWNTKCMSKTSTIREWNWWVNPNNGIFKGYIQRFGLEHLIKCSYRNAEKIVVSTFVERWHPETNTFHMPFGEMTITLDDVSSILGIHVSGAAVAPLGDDDDTNFELSVKYLGVTDEETTEQLHQYSDEYVSLSWLRA
ncbi:PREDICTED: serine/threonine-protein phosphatase 7 long form homolog [Prunus mume]|uniref:Serine/threonine-protein phosphatase 7 long form homolog n=1 Tax=Prunus mume TaxID=102107 RepID=A0ABM0NRK9_PRUMU|nr:PREDICTED: serine/threonine-protein phosphatase 7 long form homolog [Prunus mume]